MKHHVKPGSKVRATKDHGHVKAGSVGTVQAVHEGVYYAVLYPGQSTSTFTPPSHCEDHPAEPAVNDPTPNTLPSSAALDYDDVVEMRRRFR